MHWKAGNKILIVFNSIVRLLKKHINSSYVDTGVSTLHTKYIQGLHTLWGTDICRLSVQRHTQSIDSLFKFSLQKEEQSVCMCVCVKRGLMMATGGRGEEMQRKTVVWERCWLVCLDHVSLQQIVSSWQSMQTCLNHKCQNHDIDRLYCSLFIYFFSILDFFFSLRLFLVISNNRCDAIFWIIVGQKSCVPARRCAWM